MSYRPPPVSVGVSNTSGQFSYSIPPWLQGVNWTQAYGRNLAQVGTSTSLGNSKNGGHQA